MKHSKAILPTKLNYLLLVCFCLMTLIPMLAGAYAASLMMRAAKDQGQPYLPTVSLVGLFSLIVACLGFLVVRQILMPIVQIRQQAKNIASGNLLEEPKVESSTDEIQDLTQSLQRSSRNAKELLDKVEKLSLKDKLTGLYNAAYIRERLDEEIQRAIHYQRPCSFGYLSLKHLDAFAQTFGENATDDVLKQVANIVNSEMREFDRAACVGRGEFVIILPDKNTKKCIDMVETINRKISALGLKLPTAGALTICAGISENPIDGVNAEGLYLKAQERMRLALTQGKVLQAFN